MSSAFELEQLRLALRADLGDQQVAAVALLLLLGELGGVVQSRPLDFQAWKPPVIDATSV